MAGRSLMDSLSWKSEPGSDSDSEIKSDSESVSDLDIGEIEHDPAPKRSRSRKGSADTPRVTAAAKKEARETLEALVELPVTLWARRDPTCAAVAAEQQGEIVDAFMALVVKRPAWLAALTDLGASGDWIRMVKAVYPVAMVVLAHHVSHTIGDQEEDDGDLSAFHAPRLAS